MNLKRMMCLLLCLAMLLSLAACGGDENGTSGDTDEPSESSTPSENTAPSNDIAVENPAVYVTLSYGATAEEFYYLTAYTNEDGTAYVEYVGEEKKVGALDGGVLHGITAELEKSGLLALDGRQEWSEGEAMGSMYVTYADGSGVMADFGGVVPAEFTAGYQVMEAYFQALTADIPVYVPSVQVVGDVDPEELAALQEIVNNAGMENPDALAIMSIAMDDYFAMSAGLSNAEGIASGSTCSAMMMTTPYSLTVVTVSDESGIADVCADFEASMDWRKWVCVAPTNALIAYKGDMVLCLMGSDELYSMTASSVAAAGWTEFKTLSNPDM